MKNFPASKKTFIFFFMLLITIAAAALSIIEINIDFAPNVLNLSNKGTVVTIHTNLLYSTVQSTSLTLDGVEIQSSKADNQGYFVAKFNIDEIKALPLVVDEYHTFTLKGNLKTGEEFIGTKSILIINKTGK